MTLTFNGIVRNSETARAQFGEFFNKLVQLVAETFPDFELDSPGATLDIDDLEIVD